MSASKPHKDKDEPIWLSRDMIMITQERLLAEFGGGAGVRDEGMLDSALMRPQNRFTYLSSEKNSRISLCELAACYAYGLIRNHPFIDGNKRIGFVAAALFLKINGAELIAQEVDATLKTLALAAHEIDETGYAVWLQSVTTRA